MPVPTNEAWGEVQRTVRRVKQLPPRAGLTGGIHQRYPPHHGFVRVVGQRQPSGYYLGVVTERDSATNTFADRLDVPVWVRTINYHVLTVGTAGATDGEGVYWGRGQDLIALSDELDTGTGLTTLPEYVLDDSAGHATIGTGTDTDCPGGAAILYESNLVCESGQVNFYRRAVALTIVGGCLALTYGPWLFVRTVACCTDLASCLETGTGTGMETGTGTGTGPGGSTIETPCGDLKANLTIALSGCACLEALGTVPLVYTEGVVLFGQPPADGWYLTATVCGGKTLELLMVPCTGENCDGVNGFHINGHVGSGDLNGGSTPQPGCIVNTTSPSLVFSLTTFGSDSGCTNFTAVIGS